MIQHLMLPLKAALVTLCVKLGCEAQDLAAILHVESECNPAAINPAAGTVGIMQFQPATLRALGWKGTPQEFTGLSALAQLPYVRNLFVGVSRVFGPLTTIDRLYRAVLYPVSLKRGDTEDTVIFAKGSRLYWQNRGLDMDKDGTVTVGDIRAKFAAVKARPFLCGQKWD